MDTYALAVQQLKKAIENAIEKAISNGELPQAEAAPFIIETPADRSHGDFATNAAMAGAKAFRMPPFKIAQAITSNLDLEGTMFDRFETAGPGFINFFLGTEFYSAVIREILANPEAYGRSEYGRDEKVMVEFVSANPTGPMHMGNARGGALGDCLAAVLDKAGYNAWREFYVNDAGNQIQKFGCSLEARYLQIFKGDEIEFPEDGYHGDDIKELAKLFCEKYGDDWLKLDTPERHKMMAEFGLSINLPKMKRDLARYGIEYDQWFLESSLHASGYVADSVQKLTDAGFTYEKDGALWLHTSKILADKLLAAGKKPEDIEKLELKDDVLRRANGFYTYFAADIAYHRNKFEQRGFDKVINVWGADHHGHVARLKGAMDALGLDGEHRLDIVLMQLVKLMRGGEVVRMSKRTGKAISLSDLLDEIPVDAARYFFNSRPESPVEFDLDLAVRQDSENPVYYVQYAHARICTMLSALAADGHEVPDINSADLSLLSTEQERELIKQVALLPEEIRLAARDYDPSRINKYVTELAARFHRFYTACRIKGAEEGVLNARLCLADTVRKVIALSLSVIGVSAPEKM